MDPLTHLVLGASLGHAVFARRLQRAGAMAGGLAGIAPDVDIFIRSASDPLLAIEYHRGFTHALAFAPVGAAVVAAIWLLQANWRDRTRWTALWLCSLVAYLSHLLLDAATSYGTRLFWPFSDHRAGWDLISIIDPPFTLALLAGVVWSLRRRTIRPAVIGLAFAGAYLALGAVQHARGVAAVRRLAASRGHSVERLEAMPTLANNLVWRTLYQHDGRIHADRIRVGWLGDITVREGWSVPVVRLDDLSPQEKARNAARSFQRFAWFSEEWVGRSPADPAVLADMRYSLSSEAFDPIWGITFTPPGSGSEVAWIDRSRSRDLGLGPLWREAWGADPRFHPLP